MDDAQGWRPIETAPKDGTMVDLWCRATHGRDMRITDMWWIERGIWRSGRRDPFKEEMATRATHWRPIPAPPEVAPLGGDDE
jgi:hypothetical protein